MNIDKSGNLISIFVYHLIIVGLSGSTLEYIGLITLDSIMVQYDDIPGERPPSVQSSINALIIVNEVFYIIEYTAAWMI